MAKIFTYTIILVCFILLINLMGYTTSGFKIIQALFPGGDVGTGDIKSGDLYQEIAKIMAITAGVIIIGSFTRQNTDSMLVLALGGFLLSWIVMDLVSIPSLVTSVWVKNILSLIIYPLTVGYMIMVVQWWRGSDVG